VIILRVLYGRNFSGVPAAAILFFFRAFRVFRGSDFFFLFFLFCG